MSTSEPQFFSQISQPANIAQKRFCIQNLQMYLSFQEKKRFVNLLHGLKVTAIFVILENSGVLFKHPVVIEI